MKQLQVNESQRVEGEMMKLMARNDWSGRGRAGGLALLFVGLSVVQPSAWSAKEAEISGRSGDGATADGVAVSRDGRRHFRSGHSGGGTLRA